MEIRCTGLPIGTLERVEGKKQQSIKCPGKPMCAICIAPAPGQGQNPLYLQFELKIFRSALGAKPIFQSVQWLT
jgi:hypothetical protein